MTAAPSPVLAPQVAHAEVISVDELVKERANQFHVKESVMREVISCESDWNVHAIGDHGHARGLAQINDIYHPEVSQEQAFDPDFAITFMAKAMSEGRASEWTCWRQLK